MSNVDARAKLFVAAARRLKGTRWRHRGRKPWAVDCLGLLALSGEAAGLELTQYMPRVYGREPWENALQKGLREAFGDPLPASARRYGDVALIRWRREEPSHVAIVADHPTSGLSMIHAHNIHGVVEHAIAPPFDKVIVEIYRPWHGTSSQ